MRLLDKWAHYIYKPADGYAAIMPSKDTPGGIMFVGIWTTLEAAQKVANKQPKCEIRPMWFAERALGK